MTLGMHETTEACTDVTHQLLPNDLQHANGSNVMDLSGPGRPPSYPESGSEVDLLNASGSPGTPIGRPRSSPVRPTICEEVIERGASHARKVRAHDVRTAKATGPART